jgi:tRNA-dihydrouridine synthase
MSKVPANYDAIIPIVQLRNKLSPDTKIVINGDITSRSQAEELVKKYQIDGAMIGRGIFHDPFVFSKNSPWAQMPPKEKVNLLRKHVELFDKTWPNGERKFNTLKKFAKVYLNGFAGAKELREKIMATNSAEDLLAVIKGY